MTKISTRATLIELGGQPCVAKFMVSDNSRNHGYEFSTGPISSDFARRLSGGLYTAFDVNVSITPVAPELPTPAGNDE